MKSKFQLSFLILSILLILSCENPLEDKVDKLEEELEHQKNEQKNQSELIESLLAQLIAQQNIIEELNVKQLEYSDSLYKKLLEHSDSNDSEQIIKLDSLNQSLKNYIDDLVFSQNQILDMLVNSQPEAAENYIRIDSTQICWGDGMADSNGEIVIFPKPFSIVPSVVMTRHSTSIYKSFKVAQVTLESAVFQISSDTFDQYSYIATGRWK
ncbi:MAG: hypothetical protein H6609_09455 [Ignavibacteriales bacterium]|nr:hypothetical protein [Ignavibacteriales bacterium]